MKFSVIVVMYQPKLQKVLLTLQSILQQEFEDFEIVISDDGSEENYFQEIEAFLQQNHFSNYKLVANKKNQGTVKNLLSALEHASGTYVRDFGPGDAFYDEHSLQKIYDFMEKKQLQACFGLMRGYRMTEENTMEYGNFYHPFDIEAYRKTGNRNRILKNLILYSDNVSGACTCYSREFYVKYLKKIEKYVTYEEDLFQVLSSLEGSFLQMMDEYIVWYEMDDGVSTKKHSKFEELLRQDVERFHEFLYQEHGDNKYVKKRKRLSKFYRIKNLYLRTLLRIFVNPDAVRYLLSSMIQRKKGAHTPEKKGKGLLEQVEFWDLIKERTYAGD